MIAGDVQLLWTPVRTENVLFLDHERETMKASKKKGIEIIRYGDIYQSANRTPTSSAKEHIS